MLIIRSVVAAIMWAALLTTPLIAQGLTGQISGTINDSSGSAVVGVEVNLLNEGTGQTRQITSDSSGNFLFTQLLAGSYTLTLAAPGFKRYEEKEIILSSSERAVVRPITLQLGAISESISVTAEAAKLQTQLQAFNTGVVVAPAAGKFGRGNSPKDAFRGPGINNWDLALMKNFKWREGSRLVQFRFETYNSFNHTQFGGANGTGNSVDTVARFDATGKQVNARFGQYLLSRDGRRVQLGLKFSF